MRVASASAKLGVTFVGLGLHPGMGCTHTLPRIVGSQTAARLLLTGEVIDGVEAERIGVVAEAVRSDEEAKTDGDAAIEQAVALAAKMARQAPVAVRATVRTLRMQVDDGFERALWREADAQAQSYATADLAEGVEAVASKSAPAFSHYEAYTEEGVWSGVLSGRRV
jgi:enoyl-CoA hydratase/carnithine racemase